MTVILYFPIPHNALCLPPKFCINHCYNIARVLALYKSYWAAMNKIFIYARPCVNKMTWAFFFPWLQSCRLLSCSTLFLVFKIWKKPAKNCPIFLSALTFSVLIQQAAKIKPNLKKNSQVARFANLSNTSCSKFWPKDIHWEQNRHQLVINNI